MLENNNFNLEQYRQEKIDNLQKILRNYYPRNIDFVWIQENSRRRITLQIDQKNKIGFFKHKSHILVEIEEYSLVDNKISQLLPVIKEFINNQEQNLFSQIIITLFDNGLDLVFVSKRSINYSQRNKLLDFAKINNFNLSIKINNDIEPIYLPKINQIFIDDLHLDVSSEIFLQATKSGLDSIINFIKNNISASQNIADIYSGCGIYSFAIQNLVKKIDCFEGSKSMVDLINLNAKKLQLTQKIKGFERDLFFAPLTSLELKKYDCVIVNPPRNGALPQVEQLAKSNVNKIIYVSCNPISFARDIKILIESYFKLTNIVAIDQFYLTNHLELVTIFNK
jgi:23S rRNA (uracil1939-C5)-methyltransferase